MDVIMEYTTDANTPNNSLITNTTAVIEREKFIYIGTAFIIISISGFLGNVLVMFAMAASTKLQTATNVFIVNLSIADLFTCLVIPFNSLIMFSSFETPIPEWFCGIVAGVTFTSASCSIFTLAMIAINRFLLIKSYKIYHTIFSHLGIVVLITFTWVAAFSATTLPPLLGVGQLGINQKYRLCGGVSSHEGINKQAIIQTVTCFPLPMSIIIFCYTSIYFHIRRHYKKMTRSLSIVNSFHDNTDNSMSRSSVDAGPQPGSTGTCRKSSSGTMTRMNHSSTALAEDSGQRRVSKSRIASISGTLKRSNKRRRDQLSISKNLFYTTIAFAACVTPYSLFIFIPKLTGMELPILLLHCSGVLLLMSSAINPFLYGFKHPHFKEVFVMLLTGRWSQVPNPNTFKTILETCGSRGNAASK